MDDLPSSPDPLGDDPPSSAQSYSRRNGGSTLTNHELSTINIPRNALIRGSPTRNSPRKRTFELDVGNELSPQKILVTVEAEEAMRRGINRRLFPSFSPTRADYREERITTTTVPLNDEIVNESTPRRRGRPRRSSNGTPMPRGKKRAGTPIQTASKRTRQKDDPESEISMLNDTPVEADSGSTPKAKAKARKTPKSVSTVQAVPSSQLSNVTKRKRGRPRKAPVTEEVTILADMDDQRTGDVTMNDTVQPSHEMSGNSRASARSRASKTSRHEESRQGTAVDDTLTLIDEIARGSDGTPTPADISNSYREESQRQGSESHTMSHQEEGHDDEDDHMGDDYPPLMEHSDAESDLGDMDGAPYSGQDTLAHASDFSMIAVESLPSFQANRSAFPTDPPDIGSETNHIINETLESLRNSLREETAHQSPVVSNRDTLPVEEDRSAAPEHSLAEASDYSLLGRPRSPKRQKQVPLSRQVLTGKAPHVDDSFSSIPESVLRAATPGRLPIKPTSTNIQHEDTEVYDDSFSEIPEAVLEAATPKPASRTADTAVRGHTETPQVSSVNRHTGSNFGSSRLPTPDDTSSSNAGSKRAPDDDMGESSKAPTVAVPTSNSGFQSSPPIINRPRAMDFGQSRMDQEINNTPELQHSSPQLPPSTKEATEPSKSLELPHINRPSLSPIVRVGRTLQNVMSDRSSPDVREGSLGSPFRGPANKDSSRPVPFDPTGQLSIAKSPTRTFHDSTHFNAHSSLYPNDTLVYNMRTNFSQGKPPAQGDLVANLSDPFGPDKIDYSQTEAVKKAAYGNDNQVPEHGHSAFNPSVASSTRAMPPSDDEMNWVANSDHQQQVNHRPDPETMRSQNSSRFATNGSNASQALARNTELAEREVEDEHMHEPEQEGEEEDTGGNMDYEEDDEDLWDVEASRPTPRKPEPARRASQLFDPPPRRTKLPSPWRRTSRRLIYREEIASPSQIEIEENAQSEPEEPPVRPRSRPSNAHSMIQEREPESAEVDEYSSDPPGPPAQEPEQEPEIQEQPAEPTEHAEPTRSTEPAGTKEVSEYSMLARTEDAPSTQKKAAPAKSGLFGGFNILSFFSSPATLPTKVPEAGQSDTSQNTKKVTQPVFQQPAAQETEQAPKEPQKSIWSANLFPSIPQKEFQPSPERRTNLFSPLPPSQSNATIQDTYDSPSPAPSPSPEPSASPEPASPEPTTLEPASPEPAYSQSPEQSPEPSPSPIPSHEQSPEMPPEMSPEPSPQPSTPERNFYPPIEQKRNFTPRPGQSNSLFRAGPSTARSESTDDGLLLPPSDEPQESSLLTDGTEYERLPPREKPSRWDRTLSPSKSCFRSPMKPITPGRVVAFKPSMLSPAAQAQLQARTESQLNGENKSNGGLFQKPPLLLPKPVPRVNDSTAPSSQVPLRRNIAPVAPIAPTANRNPALTSATNKSSNPPAAKPQPRPPPSSPAKLSQTEWSRQHWLRLDEMLELRRRDPLAFQQQMRLPPRSQWRSLATLLGKEVAAQGESVLLETWHLEVVEAFRLEVGGWDDRSLAKRVFALIVGEERRRRARGVGVRGEGDRVVSW
ncbi:hypothetical protein F4804DRAFT_353804 [Jackrogersella minutella]|nr:hypothetical protein F4804DRAFT_353804 [Jackrogersella minutella]